MAEKKINVKGMVIRLSKIDADHYISLTDLAKVRSERPASTIEAWMHNRGTLSFLKAWEKLNNPDFKVMPTHDFKGFQAVKDESFERSFIMCPAKWIAYTNGIGFKVKRGRYCSN